MRGYFKKIVLSSLLACLLAMPAMVEGSDFTMNKEVCTKLEQQLIQKYGDSQKDRAIRGIKQVANIWTEEDGTADDFEKFVTTFFAGSQSEVDKLYARFVKQLEQIYGHNLMIQLSLREQVDLDLGPIEPVDQIFAGFDPSAHLLDDCFRNKLAHIVLLNFPVTTLEERIQNEDTWTRRQWAEARLASHFSKRIPADVNQKVTQAFAESDSYIGDYKFYMHHVLNEKGDRLFKSGLKLLSHWDLRDEIRALYSSDENAETVLTKQRMLQTIMEKVILQKVPEAVINNPNLDWNLATDEVTVSPVKDEDRPDKKDIAPSAKYEDNTRYQVLLNIFKACKLMDPYSPTAPTLIDRRFNEDREIPEAGFRSILEQVLTSKEVVEISKMISERLGRPLEPFDLWYTGFQSRGTYSEEYLDKLCKQRYPSLQAFQDDIPNILMKLGFDKKKAKYIGAQIQVDPVRGSGHAWGAAMRFEKAHLRTDVMPDGMGYKGFNTAMHELGHCTEQTISLHWIDEYMLNGVPNTAFTEGMAFVFQGKDIEVLGLKKPNEKALAGKALHDLWGTYEIAGVAMVDIDVWHWMYDHPEATAAELKDAVIEIAKKHWNTYYEPIFGHKDCILLAIYSHMIHSGLYLPDYPLGHIVAAQVEHYVENSGNLGSEVERMNLLGCIAPDLWMKKATGSPVSAQPMLDAASKAITLLKK